jgi:hypothetical protein
MKLAVILFLFCTSLMAQPNNPSKTGRYNILKPNKGSTLFLSPTGNVHITDADFLVENGQVGIGTTAPTIDGIFEVVSTTKGSRPFPLMTEAQRDAILTPTQGLFAYNTDASRLDYYNGSEWTATGYDGVGSGGGGGGLVLVYEELVGSSGPHSTAIPGDATIPQNTEGVEILTATITPTGGVTDVLVEVVGSLGETTNTNNVLIAALFQDSTANALASEVVSGNDDGAVIAGGPYAIRKKVSVSAGVGTTFKLRVGGNSGGAMYANTRRGSGYGDTQGGVMVTSITITEL